MHRSNIPHSLSLFAANNNCCSHSAGVYLKLLMLIKSHIKIFIIDAVVLTERSEGRNLCSGIANRFYFYFTAVFNLSMLSCILFEVVLSLLFHRVKK